MNPKCRVSDRFLVRFPVPRNTFPNVTVLHPYYPDSRPAIETFPFVNTSRLITSLSHLRLTCDLITQRARPPGDSMEPEDIVSLCFREGARFPLEPRMMYVLDAFEEMAFERAVILPPGDPTREVVTLTLEFERAITEQRTHPLVVTSARWFEVDPSPETA